MEYTSIASERWIAHNTVQNTPISDLSTHSLWSTGTIKIECITFRYFIMKTSHQTGHRALLNVNIGITWSNHTELHDDASVDFAPTISCPVRLAHKDILLWKKMLMFEHQCTRWCENSWYITDVYFPCSCLLPLWQIRELSLIHIWRCRRIERCRSRWSPYH